MKKTLAFLIILLVLLVYSCDTGDSKDGNGATGGDDPTVPEDNTTPEEPTVPEEPQQPQFPLQHMIEQQDGYIPYINAETLDFDFDGDSDLILYTPFDHPMLFLENTNQGNFSIHSFGSETQGHSKCQFTDFDNDDQIDFFSYFYGFTSGSYGLYMNNGYNVFTQKALPLSAQFGPTDFKIVDIDQDRSLDLLVMSAAKGSLQWMKQAHDGGLNYTNIVDGNAEGGMSLDAADLDQDGRVDIVTCEYADKTLPSNAWGSNCSLIWWERNSLGAFRRNVLATNLRYPEVVLADLDNRGDLEILVIDDNRLTLYRGDGEGTFTMDNLFPSRAVSEFYLWDFESDGDMDIICHSGDGYDDNNNGHYETYVILLENDGSGSFTTSKILEDLERSYPFPGDFNGDGDMDIFLIDNLNYSFSWWELN